MKLVKVDKGQYPQATSRSRHGRAGDFFPGLGSFFLILFLNELRLAHNIVNSNQAKPSRAKIKDSKFSEQSFLSFQLLWIESLFAPKSSFFASKFFPVVWPQYCIFFRYRQVLFLQPILYPIFNRIYSPIWHLFLIKKNISIHGDIYVLRNAESSIWYIQ